MDELVLGVGAPGDDVDQVGPTRTGLVVGVLALAGIAVSLMQTLVIPIVPRLPVLLDATASSAAWAVTATLLAGAVVTPIAGRLGDMVGKKPVLLASVVAMVVGSLLCALAGSLELLVVGRAVQGLAAGVIPLGMSLMRDVLPPQKLGPAVALMSASLGVGGALGLPAAALIVERASWHVLFWVAAGLGAVVFGLVLLVVPAARAVRARGRLDVGGAVGLSVALVSLLLAVSKGAEWGWSSPRVLGLLVLAVVAGLVWGRWQLRTSSPLVDLRTTARPQVLITNVASLVFGFSMFAMSLVVPQVVQLPAETGFGLGRSILVAGLVMVPSGLVMMVAAPVSAAVSRRTSPRVTLMIGALVVAVGYALGVFFLGSVWQLCLVTGLIGAGIGFAYGSLPQLIMSAVPVGETSSANGFNTLVRSIGTSVSSAVAGAVLAASATVVGGVSAPTLGGFQTILVLGSAAAFVTMIITLFLPRKVS
nr:MFS transporter [Microlunatus antarcticus]